MTDQAKRRRKHVEAMHGIPLAVADSSQPSRAQRQSRPHQSHDTIPLWQPPDEPVQHRTPQAKKQPWTPRDGLRQPVVRLAQEHLDERTFAALVRIDEALRTRAVCGDTATLDRIQTLFRNGFRSFSP